MKWIADSLKGHGSLVMGFLDDRQGQAIVSLTNSKTLFQKSYIFTLYFKVLLMNQEKYKEDLKDIREIMHKSTRFISLSGLSGILAGIFALAGLYLAYNTVYSGQDYFAYRTAELSPEILFRLLGIAVSVLILAILSAAVFTARKAKRHGQKLWDRQHKRLIVNFSIPLIAGGLICLILLTKGFIGLVAPLTLVFYGLALVHASKYTLNEIRFLGYIEIVLGIFAAQFIGYGLIFWGLGFGVAHIVYGVFMQMKYGS